MFIPLDNKKFSKNLAIFPGLHFCDKNIVNESFKFETTTKLDDDVISEKIFLKLYQIVNNEDTNKTKKKRFVNKKTHKKK